VFDTRGALNKVMSRVARQLTPSLRASALDEHWDEKVVRQLTVQVDDAKLYFYANYRADVEEVKDLEYGSPGVPPRPALHNYFESHDEQARARRLVLIEAREFAKEFDRVLGRI
jgi:hypothetical protein